MIITSMTTAEIGVLIGISIIFTVILISIIVKKFRKKPKQQNQQQEEIIIGHGEKDNAKNKN